jgi:hypothetical protein
MLQVDMEHLNEIGREKNQQVSGWTETACQHLGWDFEAWIE